MKEIKEAYQKLIDTMSRAHKYALQGNTTETEFTVHNILSVLQKLGRSIESMAEWEKLALAREAQNDAIDGVPENLKKVWHYVSAPQTFIAESYLVSAEKALIRNDMYCVANAYKRIKPGENLRKLLDAQDLPENNLKERANKLDQLVSVMQNSQSGMARD